jgi:hypothetical protein
MILPDPSSLGQPGLDTTLAALPGFSAALPLEAAGEALNGLFERQPDLPGVLVFNGPDFFGMIPREAFYERTGKKFGVEIYLKRSLDVLIEQLLPPLVLPASLAVSSAVSKALQREKNTRFYPLVVLHLPRSYTLTAAHTLFLAQNRILENIQAQRLYCVNSGYPWADADALARLAQFCGLSAGKLPAAACARHRLRCDACGEAIDYSLADVVRTFGQINQAVTVESRMGARSYWFYVRHRCGGGIREIAAQHDERFEYRSQRPGRVVERYA